MYLHMNCDIQAARLNGFRFLKRFLFNVSGLETDSCSFPTLVYRDSESVCFIGSFFYYCNILFTSSVSKAESRQFFWPVFMFVGSW